MQKEVLMELLSSEYGWTPNEVKELTVSELRNYLDIIQEKRKIENKLAKQKAKR
jgi:hypothetical protein